MVPSSPASFSASTPTPFPGVTVTSSLSYTFLFAMLHLPYFPPSALVTALSIFCICSS